METPDLYERIQARRTPAPRRRSGHPWLLRPAKAAVVLASVGLALGLLVVAAHSHHSPSSPPGGPADTGSSIANELITAYGLSDIQSADVSQGNSHAGTRKPWLYLTIGSIGPNGAQTPEGTRAMWQGLLLTYAYQSQETASGAPHIDGVSFLAAGDQTCTTPSALSCDAETMSLERELVRDPSAWLTDKSAITSAITSRVASMDNANLVSVKFDKGVNAPLPDVTVETDNPIAFAKAYRYGSVAVLGDDSRYEGYILTVVDANGDPVSVNAESYALSTGLGWTRPDVRSIIQAAD